MSDDPPKVAIACQGGGSHTAFTAGVLQHLLREPEPGYDIVGFSGTSGGAICATLAWYGLLHDDHDPGHLLQEFWADLAATDPIDRAANEGLRWGAGLRTMGITLPEASPYWNPAAAWGQRRLGELIERNLDFEEIPGLLEENPEHPVLLISAIEVLTGEFELFREDDLCVEVLLASTAEPNMFRAVEVNGRTYWDGLFSKNPPVADFNVEHDATDPDEVWIVRINPEERVRVPKSLNGIFDRRNELSGNLSLGAEIHFMRRVNRWIEQGFLPDRYTHTEIRHIRLERQLEWTTKLDRSPEFVERLMRDGRRRAEEFLEHR